jgi:tetratricopeptide (TPR) repeat protein
VIVAGAAELVEEGVRHFVAGRVSEARAAFERALAVDPTNEKARLYLADIAPPRSAARAQPPAAGPDAEEYAPSPWDEGPAAAATIRVDGTGGLDLTAVSEKSDITPLVPAGRGASAEPRGDVDIWLSAAKELFALGDFSGSLELIEKILQVDPDHGEARDYLRQNEATLVSMYESKLGSLTLVPRLAIKPEEVLWLNLDHRAGFLLAQIDGTVDYETLFALSGLPRLDTARILANLIADGVIRA